MKIVVMGQFTDKEEEELASVEMNVRPNEPLQVSTARGTQFVNPPLGTGDDLVIRIPVASESETESPAA